MATRSADIIIVGGGVNGVASAYNLVKRMERERATPAPHWLDTLVDVPKAAALV